MIFSDYGTLAVWQWKVCQKDRPMTMACQFGKHLLRWIKADQLVIKP